MAQHQFPQRKKNALDHPKLKLSAPVPTAQGKWATFAWMISGNNPRIVVYTNDPNDSRNDNGRITGPMDARDFQAILIFLKRAVDAPGKYRDKVQLKNFIFPGGKRSEKPVVVSELWVGKDEEGVVWMSLTAGDRPKIKFVHGPSDFVNFFKEDGTEYTKGELSQVYAQGYINLLAEMIPQLLISEYKEPEPKNNDGGGRQQNGGQRQNNGGGGGQSNSTPAADYDDDLPF